MAELKDKLVNLEDLKVVNDDLLGKCSDLKNAIDHNDECDRLGLIPYACNGSNTNILSVVQNGNEVTINGTSNASASQSSTKILLTDHIHSWNANTTPDANKVYPIQLIAGHTYNLKASVISGSRSKGEGAGNITIRFIAEGVQSIDPPIIIGINETENEISYQSSGEYVQIRMFISRLMTLTNAVVRIELSDITTEIELDGKQDKLTFDAAPMEGSSNPVQSNGLYSDINMMKNAFGKQLTQLDVDEDYTIAEGSYWNSETDTAVIGSSSNYKRTSAIPVSAGEQYYLKIYCAASIKQDPILVVDSNYKILDKYRGETGKVSEYYITIPPDGAYMCLTTSLNVSLANIFKYELKSVEDMRNEIELELEEIRDAIGKNEILIATTSNRGVYWNCETSNAVLTNYSSYCSSNPIPVNPGEQYRISIYSANSKKQKPYLLVNYNGTEYEIIDGNIGNKNEYNDFNITIPIGVTHILMTTDNTHAPGNCYRVELNHTGGAQGIFEYKGANIAIIGDSISTNGDYSASNLLGNVPEIVVGESDIGVELSAYVTYYDVGTTIGGHTITESEVGTELTFTPVAGDLGKIIGKPKNNNLSTTNVWWEVAADALGFNPIPVCWSGSSITDHEENKTDEGHYIYKCAHSFHPSQIRKCGIRIPGSMERIAPDMIIIYRGTNDLSHSPYARITDGLDSFPATYPDTDTFDDGGTIRYSYVNGMRLLIKKLHEAYPETKIVLCTLNYFRRLSHTAIYTDNGVDNWMKYNAMIRRIADFEGCDLIEFDKDGLNYWNAANGYYNEGTSATAYWTHPNTKGQTRLGNRALIDLRMVNDMTVPT